jgi:hypothetical protein
MFDPNTEHIASQRAAPGTAELPVEALGFEANTVHCTIDLTHTLRSL